MLLSAVGGASVLLGVRYRLPARIAVRNIRRARTRSVLVVLGLLVGTAIISGSLAVGDTVQAVNVHYTNLAWGYVDEGVYSLGSTGNYQYFPSSVAYGLANATAADPQISGVSPEVIDSVQLFDRTNGVPQTNLFLIGTDANRTGALGPFVTTAGVRLQGPSAGGVFIDQYAAEQIGASAGDTVTLYAAGVLTTKIQAVVQDDLRGAFLTGGLQNGAVFTDLPTAQVLANATGEVNFIAVTNVGSQSEGVELSPTVCARLNATLAGIPGASGLSAHPDFKQSINGANAAGSGLVTIFLVFGLFSIVAGAMLIVGIFTMLAEERKGEMGMLRAVGLTRRDVVLSYYFEGLIYSAGSALAGIFVGVLTGFLLLYAYVLLLGSQSAGTAAVLTSFTYTNSSLLVSYLAGFFLTLGTVAVASVRVSRLNIVRAIRDVPEPPPPLRAYTYLAWIGVALLAAGAYLFATTYRGSTDISFPIVAGGMVVVGAGLVASRFAKNRPVFSGVGAGLLIWAGWQGLQVTLLGTGHAGGIFVVFVEGIELIGGAVLLFAFNGPQLARALERAAAGRIASAPVARMGLAYPSRRATRTAITTTIFALVLFVIVVLATYSATLTGNLNDSISAQSGGYTFFGYSARPIPNLAGTIAANGTLSPVYQNIVPIVVGLGYLSGPAISGSRFVDNIYAAPASAPAGSNFYSTNQFPFQSTAHGESPSEVMAELATNRSVAIVDGSYAGAGFTAGGAHPIVAVGAKIAVTNPGTGSVANVTIVGILQQLVLGGMWLNPATATSLGYTSTSGYLFKVAPGVSPTYAAQKTKAAFYTYGLVLVDFTVVLATTIAVISGQIGLLEVFIGLGLAVGIAALGIVAHRAVVERRREIGMLRATGLTRAMILRMFLLEYSFVTLFGAAIGGLVGLLLIYNLVTSPGAAAAEVTKLYIPWLNLIAVMLVTGLLATLSVIGPSRRAARLSPAEAVRGVE